MERKRAAIFNVGILVAGSFTLAAFTYTEKTITEAEKLAVAVDENITFVVTEKEPEPVVQQPRTPQPQSDQQDQQQQNLGSQTAVNELTSARDNGNEGPKPPGGPGGYGSVPGGKVVVSAMDPIVIPERDAEYIGGRQAMMEKIISVQKYPEIDRELGIQGKVYVSFVVEKDGSITNIKTERGVSETLDREAVRIVQSFPKWKPGEDKYGVVRTRVRMPIVFVLQQ